MCVCVCVCPAQMVFLGFVEECEDSSELRSEFFPCKAGGVPAWLDLRRSVPPEGLRCLRCASPMLFLLQLYSPMPEAEQDAFHRSLFLFCCPSSQCQAFSDRARSLDRCCCLPFFLISCVLCSFS